MGELSKLAGKLVVAVGALAFAAVVVMLVMQAWTKLKDWVKSD